MVIVRELCRHPRAATVIMSTLHPCTIPLGIMHEEALLISKAFTRTRKLTLVKQLKNEVKIFGCEGVDEFAEAPTDDVGERAYNARLARCQCSVGSTAAGFALAYPRPALASFPDLPEKSEKHVLGGFRVFCQPRAVVRAAAVMIRFEQKQQTPGQANHIKPTVRH